MMPKRIGYKISTVLEKKKEEKWGSSIFLKDLDLTNHLNCRLLWSIYTIYVRGKLDQGGGHTFILKILKTLIFPFLTGNINAFIHV